MSVFHKPGRALPWRPVRTMTQPIARRHMALHLVGGQVGGYRRVAQLGARPWPCTPSPSLGYLWSLAGLP
jgi:hypothetical protein